MSCKNISSSLKCFSERQFAFFTYIRIHKNHLPGVDRSANLKNELASFTGLIKEDRNCDLRKRVQRSTMLKKIFYVLKWVQ